MSELTSSTVEQLARAAGLVVDPERLPAMEIDYAAALAMIEYLHSVETGIVPGPFSPDWDVTAGDDAQ